MDDNKRLQVAAILGVLAFLLWLIFRRRQEVSFVLRDEAGNVIQRSVPGSGGIIIGPAKNSEIVDMLAAALAKPRDIASGLPIEPNAVSIGPTIFGTCPEGHHAAVREPGGEVFCAKD